ncbi:hypothetical protein [Novosphingobium aquiterrae]
MKSDSLGTDEQADLVQQLILEAGRIMENVSPDLAMRLPANSLDREKALVGFCQIADAIHKLATAGLALSKLEDLQTLPG